MTNFDAGNSRFILPNHIYRLLCCLDLERAWDFFCVFNPVARRRIDPYHGVDHVKIMLGGLYEYLQSNTDLSMRNLIVAIIFHDFDHSLGHECDTKNILRAVKGLELFNAHTGFPLAKIDYDRVKSLIYSTEYPSTSEYQTEEQKLIHDLDFLSIAYPIGVIENSVFDLINNRIYDEIKVCKPNLDHLEFVRSNIGFLMQIKLKTTWAQVMFSHRWQSLVERWAHSCCSIYNIEMSDDEIRTLALKSSESAS